MSTPTNTQKDGKTNKKKRKAKSPLDINSSQNGKTGLASSDSTNVSINTSTSFPFGNPQYGGMASGFNYVQSPFGQPFVSSPPYTPTAVPPWALELMEDIKRIKISVSKIDSIEKTVNRISTKVDALDTKVKSIDDRLIEVENANSFYSEMYENTKKTVESTQSEIQKLDKKCKELETAINTSFEIREKVDDLESRSLRENLLFFGINETQGENCEDLVSDLIKTKLEIDKQIEFDRVHRLGQRYPGKTRPIVAKFHKYKDRELVRNNAFEKTQTLKAGNVGIGVQHSKAILNKRKEMAQIVEREKAAGRYVKWSGAKLLVRDGPGGNYRQVTS